VRRYLDWVLDLEEPSLQGHSISADVPGLERLVELSGGGPRANGPRLCPSVKC
jgi:hypothetical protein